MSRGFIDLHCHYLPAIDDGVRTTEQGLALVGGLASIGFTTVAATPHMRAGMFDNTRAHIERVHSSFREVARQKPNLPSIILGSEHYVDEVFLSRLSAREVRPFDGDRAILVELPPERWPVRLAQTFFDVGVKGLLPVLAHPERYAPLFDSTDSLDPLLDVGALPMLDLMSLVGKYGRKPQRAAERMLEEGTYYAACSDCHRPEDVPVVAEAIARLERLVGSSECDELLRENPAKILDGTAEY